MSGFNVIVFLGMLVGPTYYIERFIDYMKRNNIEYYVVNTNITETFDNRLFDEFSSRPGTVMFTFNGIGVLLNDTDGNNYWKKHKIPVFDFIVDHPRNFSDLMIEPPCDLHVFTLDRNHEEYIRRYYPKINVFFSPNGGTDIRKSINYYDRDIEVLYMGSCGLKVTQFPCIDYFEDKGADFYRRVIDYMFTDSDLSTEDAIERYFVANDENIDDEFLSLLNIKCAGYIELYVRRQFKLRGIKALDVLNVHVDIWGEDWEDEDYPFSSNINIHNRVNCEEIMEKITRSKISLCFIPWFKKGCSEKNFDSMLNGALCVTDKSEYLNEHYVDGYNIVFFDLNNPDQMAADVKWLLDNPREAEIIAKRGYETAKRYDTWDCRFERVVEIMHRYLTSDAFKNEERSAGIALNTFDNMDLDNSCI